MLYVLENASGHDRSVKAIAPNGSMKIAKPLLARFIIQWCEPPFLFITMNHEYSKQVPTGLIPVFFVRVCQFCFRPALAPINSPKAFLAVAEKIKHRCGLKGRVQLETVA